MAAAIVLLLVVLHLGCALAAPLGLVYFSMLTGPLPLNFGYESTLMTPLGRLDMPAIRLFCLVTAAYLVIVLRAGTAFGYLPRYKWHVFFLGLCLVSIAWAPSFVFGVRMTAKVLGPFLFLLLYLVTVRTPQQLKATEQLIIISAVVSVALAAVARPLGWTHDDKLTLPATSAAVFSAHLLVVAALLLAGLVCGASKVRNGILFCIVSAAIMAAFTRITIAALFIAGSVVLYFGGRGLTKFAFPLAGIVGLPALFVFNQQFRERMFMGGAKVTADAIVDNPSGALSHVYGSGRFSAWDQILTNFFEPHPIVGSGAGATQHFFYTYSASGLGAIHSEYVRLLAEVGMVGLILYVVCMLVYGGRLLRNLRISRDRNTQKYTLAALGGLTAYVVFFATDNGFDYVNQFGVYVFALLGMSERALAMERTAARIAAKEGDATR